MAVVIRVKLNLLENFFYIKFYLPVPWCALGDMLEEQCSVVSLESAVLSNTKEYPHSGFTFTADSNKAFTSMLVENMCLQ